MRLFIAVELPEKIREALAETSSLLRASVRGRYVAPDSFHVTLAFLGQVEASRIDDVIGALEAGCRGFEPFVASLGELGKFGKRTKATLWQGLEGGKDLPELAISVCAELRRSGFEFDEKKFLPHVTLMRAADLSEGVLPIPACDTGEITTVSLFRSDLSGDRPRYEVLHAVRLG